MHTWLLGQTTGSSMHLRFVDNTRNYPLLGVGGRAQKLEQTKGVVVFNYALSLPPPTTHSSTCTNIDASYIKVVTERGQCRCCNDQQNYKVMHMLT
jgi:hypothetical protein